MVDNFNHLEPGYTAFQFCFVFLRSAAFGGVFYAVTSTIITVAALISECRSAAAPSTCSAWSRSASSST